MTNISKEPISVLHPLIGYYFCAKNKAGIYDYQGQIMRATTDSRFIIVDYFNWWDGCYTFSRVHYIEDITKWDLFKDKCTFDNGVEANRRRYKEVRND